MAGLEIDLEFLNFQKKLLRRIISDAAFSWPELMDEGKEELGGGTVDKPFITVVVDRGTLSYIFNMNF